MYDAARHPIDLTDHPVTQTVRTGKPFQGFIIGIDRADGRRTWLRVSCRPLDSDDRYGTAILVSFSDITAEQVARERLTHRATHDALTGLPNRAAVLNHITDSLRAHGDHRLGAVLFIDLDNLKAINDSLGHDSGDELCRAWRSAFAHPSGRTTSSVASAETSSSPSSQATLDLRSLPPSSYDSNAASRNR